PWKLIEGLGSGGFSNPKVVEPVPDGPEGQLYHLHDDPSETNNLYLEHPEIVKQLMELLNACRTQGRSRLI
ncbi:MAG: arylsulfatase, partial [Candidatus Poribacteria bacterium]